LGITDQNTVSTGQQEESRLLIKYNAHGSKLLFCKVKAQHIRSYNSRPV